MIVERWGKPQNHLADELHINRARMSQYATGTRAIPAHHMLLLCDALGCDVNDIVGYCEMTEVVGG